MSKSYKPKDGNYIDSTGIVHNKTLLSTLLSSLLIPSDHEITNYPNVGTNNQYVLRKIGKIVSLSYNMINLSSISGNQWVDIGQLPSGLYPTKEIGVVGALQDGNTAGISTYARIVIRTNGSIGIKTNLSISHSCSVFFSATWILD